MIQTFWRDWYLHQRFHADLRGMGRKFVARTTSQDLRSGLLRAVPSMENSMNRYSGLNTATGRTMIAAFTSAVFLHAFPAGAAGRGSKLEAAKTSIQHVIIIMQENRSFDNYFGTYPGADGIPPGTCVPVNPTVSGGPCVVPFHDVHDVNAGGPHSAAAAQADIDDGISTYKFDGFVQQQANAAGVNCGNVNNPLCGGGDPDGVTRHDVMGYHTGAELPNYWAYAEHYVLQDRLYDAMRSWSQPTHIELASEWVAVCTNMMMASTCTTDPNGKPPGKKTTYPWVSLFQLLDTYQVSWKWYLGQGSEPDCEDGEMTCDPQAQASTVASIWNPAPSFA